MVLFTEAETLLLLDLYLRLRLWPRNVASNGILLRAPARAELTRAINRAAGDRAGRQWTEAQVFVKFKNLRIDYALVRWLREQPGFKRSGMSDEWWAHIKSVRPKAHVFKGRLPWPYFSRMAMILLDIPYEPVADPLAAQRLSELLEEDAETSSMAAALAAAPALVASAPASAASSSSSEEADDELAEPAQPQPAPSAIAGAADPSPFYNPRQAPPVASKRGAAETASSHHSKRSRVSIGGVETGTLERPESLALSVDQCAASAADLARGFQELVGVFQQQALKSQEMETSGASDDALRDQRQVVLAIARSLEQSTQATADMAKGYHDLVQHYIEEGAARRS